MKLIIVILSLIILASVLELTTENKISRRKSSTQVSLYVEALFSSFKHDCLTSFCHEQFC